MSKSTTSLAPSTSSVMSPTVAPLQIPVQVPFQVPIHEEEFCTPEAALALADLRPNCGASRKDAMVGIRLPVHLVKGSALPLASLDYVQSTLGETVIEMALHIVDPRQKDALYRAAVETMPGNQSRFIWSKYAESCGYSHPAEFLDLNMVYTDGVLMIYHDDPINYYLTRKGQTKTLQAPDTGFMGATCTMFTLPAESGHARLQRARQAERCLSFFTSVALLGSTTHLLTPTLGKIMP